MGKKRLEALLTQLKDNQDQELVNSAKIYTVAQVAVNELTTLKQTKTTKQTQRSRKPAASTQPELALAAGLRYSIADLKAEYATVALCRKALKEKGLLFSKSPSWEKMAIALHHFEIQQELLQDCIQQMSEQNFTGITMTFRI